MPFLSERIKTEKSWISCPKSHQVLSKGVAKIINRKEHRFNKAKSDFEKDFPKLMNNSVFGKTLENVRKHRHIIELVTKEKRRNYFVSEPIYYSTKIFAENLFVIEIEKIQNTHKYRVDWGLSVLELSKIVMYELLVRLCKAKMVYIKTDDTYIDIAEDFKQDLILQTMN